jgi:hypothetical protein
MLLERISNQTPEEMLAATLETVERKKANRDFYVVKPLVEKSKVEMPQLTGPKNSDWWYLSTELPEPDWDALRNIKHSLNKILDEVSERHEISILDMRANRRSKEISLARHEFFWRCKNETLCSTLQIGGHLNKDHSSVVHGIKNYKKLRDLKINGSNQEKKNGSRSYNPRS